MGGATAHVARVLTGRGYKHVNAVDLIRAHATRDSLDKPSLSESFCYSSFFFAIAIVLFE